MAQWIRHLTTNQGIPGSSPGMVEGFNCQIKIHESSAVGLFLCFHNAMKMGNRILRGHRFLNMDWPIAPVAQSVSASYL